MSDQTQTSSVLPLLLPFASSAFGAFCGAGAAFWLGRRKQKMDEQDRQHSALLATQYALVSQWLIIDNLRSALEPVRNDPLRFTKLQNIIRIAGEIYVPFKDITFIIDSDAPNLLQEVHVVEQGFLATISVLDNCNKARAELLSKHPPDNLYADWRR